MPKADTSLLLRSYADSNIGEIMKNREKKTEGKAGNCCPSCGLPVTDPLWFNCPRCRATLSGCSGCEACGKCGKKTGIK